MHKLISLSLAIIFSLSIFAATGFSQSDCGPVCCCSSNMPGMQHTSNYQAEIIGACCSQVDAHPCGFTKSQDFELPLCTISAGRINTGYSFGFSSHISDSFSTYKSNPSQQRWSLAIFSIPTSPIYVQHLTLLI